MIGKHFLVSTEDHQRSRRDRGAEEEKWALCCHDEGTGLLTSDFFYQIKTTLSFCISKSFLHLFGSILRIFNALCNFSYNLSSSDLVLRCFSARSEFCKNLDKYYQKPINQQIINIELRPPETIFDLKELLISLSKLPGKLSKNRHYKKKE